LNLDSRIKVVENTKNMGLTKSLNKGLKLAKGPYIARIDCDDIALPSRLEKQVEYLDSHSEVTVLGSWYITLEKNNKRTIQQRPTDYQKIAQKIYYGNPIAHPSVMYRKAEVLKVGGYNEQYRYAQDYALWCKLIPKYRLTNIPAILVEVRQHSNNISVAHNEEQNACYRKIRRKFYLKAVWITRGRVLWGTIMWKLFKKSLE
jgi:glycosyltransferase involved in cell wall biosynthesis